MSLLKRIEQGQSSETGSKSQGSSSGGNSDSSRLSSLQTRRTNAPITSPQAGSYFDLKTRVQNKLLSELDPSMDITRTDEVKRTIQDLFEQILSEENIVLSRPERARPPPASLLSHLRPHLCHGNRSSATRAARR